MNPPADSPILVRNVSRSFGKTEALCDVGLAVRPGGIYGFLGRNGAGKTTLLRMLAGLIRPGAGEVRVLGHDPFTMGAAERQRLGYMPEKPSLPVLVKIKTLLQLGRDLYPAWDATLVENLLAKYGLDPKKRFSTLSQGNQRLVQFVLAIAPRPKVLLLDEPAATLDVVARREILDDILELTRDCGCTVFFSTHILSDVERVADEIGILAQGRLLVSEPLDHLKGSIRQVRFFGFAGVLPAEEIPGSFRTARNREEIVATLWTGPDNDPTALARRWGCQVETRPLGLEDIFVELSRT